ncbi:MAG: aldo/keto reductase [Dehalococcoidales bacterium]|jgi:aryl-alcohol dehydrogenase-like predicted oxidoreductase
MQYKKMGRTGLKISEITLGTMIFGQQVDEAESLKIIDLAFEKGINSFDTADGYAGGRSEEIVGKALKNKRHVVVLASKVASKQGPGPNDAGLSREHILQAVENSLRRLGTDYLDIYYAHHPDNTTPIEETLRAFDTLVRQGKVRYAACSNYRAGQLVRALAVSEQRNLARFDCIQTVYSLITRDIEAELLPTCADEGVGVVVYNPLAGGLLTGKHNGNQPPTADTRFGQNPMYLERYWSPINFKAVEHLKQIAAAYNRKPAQFALAWVLGNPGIASAIVGASSAAQLAENLGALDVKLSPDETKACDDVWLELRPPRFFYGR